MTDPLRGQYWLGHPGALLPIRAKVGKLARKSEQTITFKESASGRRRAYMAPVTTQREWSVEIPYVLPEEVAALHELLAATYPPYVWVEPWATVTNLLTPVASTIRAATPDVAQAGRWPMAGGGYAAVSAVNPTRATLVLGTAPVLPGLPVAGTVWVATATSASASLTWLDSAGAAIGSALVSATATGMLTLARLFVTGMPPANAARCQLAVTGAEVLARAAVTWTAIPMPWAVGGGVAQVVVYGLNDDIQEASPDDLDMRRSTVSFTVTEVGS